MPASPELTVTIRDEVVREVCDKAGCQPPRFRIRYKAKPVGSDYVVKGEYDPAEKTIDLYIFSEAKSTNQAERLRYVQRALNDTLLHELRHHVQFSTWSKEKLEAAQEGPYALQKIEVDANEWAAAYRTSIHLVRVTRKHSTSRISGMGRLSAAQEGARR